MKIYEFARAPNPRRVRIFLAEKGIEGIEFVQMDLSAGDNLSEEFRQKNPYARVPVLELDDGSYLSESVAICRYFEELYPEPALFGTDPMDKAVVEMWNRRMEINLLFPVMMGVRHTRALFPDRETIFPDWGAENAELSRQAFELLNERLGESEYIAGEQFTIADITALCALDFAKLIGLRVAELGLEHVSHWYQAVSARPSAMA